MVDGTSSVSTSPKRSALRSSAGLYDVLNGIPTAPIRAMASHATTQSVP